MKGNVIMAKKSLWTTVAVMSVLLLNGQTQAATNTVKIPLDILVTQGENRGWANEITLMNEQSLEVANFFPKSCKKREANPCYEAQVFIEGEVGETLHVVATPKNANPIHCNSTIKMPEASKNLIVQLKDDFTCEIYLR